MLLEEWNPVVWILVGCGLLNLAALLTALAAWRNMASRLAILEEGYWEKGQRTTQRLPAPEESKEGIIDLRIITDGHDRRITMIEGKRLS